ncbi:glycoside hydrolase family 79 protein [Multifurca ochricompacta]|uniref:Glycoside hydrolase family 79 protein n=1 Tax=Multifurca ochricompacta TaxID=376703 RepID=A0AAD4M2K4_9AGAM|nr:glycoside hydrolase family 79 protein [Multifurca ochricompacta]
MASFPFPFLWLPLSLLNIPFTYPKTSTSTTTGAAANYTGAAAYDPTVLNAPAVPNPPISTQIPIPLSSSGGIPNLSIPQSGAFFGFSIEMSVSNQVCNSFIQVPFLNLMANIVQRAGWVQVRVGGNSQENAELVSNTNHTSGPTSTPPLAYTTDLLYMMANISKLTNAHGVPFFNTTPFSLGIVENGQQILGDHLIGFQAGNEPDLYVAHGHRPSTYGQFDYLGEIGNLVQQIANDSLIPKKDNLLIVPSVQTLWSPESVWNTGIVQTYSNNIFALAVERYPDDNCAAVFPSLGQTPQNPQDIFINYLQHNASTNLVTNYLNSTAFAVQNNKPFIMFETNSASCSGFPGISNSFGAALWALDWAFTMAYSNFTAALYHVGGQDAYYNPFTPPPTNQSTFHQWTVGPVYYSALVMAEAFGPSNASQIVDLTGSNIYTPIYAIYENGAPTKVALFNFVTDPSGASTYTATISIGGGSTGQANATPSQVQVKYLLADSVSAKGNFTWAGQTFGNNFESDGRLQGNQNVTTVHCDQTANTCSIPVPAPGFALVFLTSAALSAISPSSTATYPTTALTRTGNTIYIDPSLLATSNGHSGMENVRGATSPGSSSAARILRDAVPSALSLLSAVLGAAVVALRW